MTFELDILHSFPEPGIFYRDYWNRRPFVVKAGVDDQLVRSLLTPEELAGLSLEEDVRSRLVSGPEGGWTCRHGPFEEEDFDMPVDRQWNLLVHNVEQFHPPVANLLPLFAFSPRWLLDDIMVSYSVPGGSVGPHIDSYHVFLVQGQGKRRWKIGSQPLMNEHYIPEIDLRVLQDEFEGTSVEVEAGDVIYIPPRIPHEGITLESALTFSVGFLGPSVPELFMAYGQYLAEQGADGERFLAGGASLEDSGFSIGKNVVEGIRDLMQAGLKGDHFSEWLTAYFSEPGIVSEYSEADPQAAMDRSGAEISLARPEEDKMVIVATTSGWQLVGYRGRCYRISPENAPIVRKLESGEKFTITSLEGQIGNDDLPALLKNIFAASYDHR
ncbi:cupin domain-containing protein [Emcibacter sp.]|uniref:cupin domain-containing protein n=1 Tax=Emcibacter sp. TaxID=1979954 RepID=UPI003A900B7C